MHILISIFLVTLVVSNADGNDSKKPVLATMEQIVQHTLARSPTLQAEQLRAQQAQLAEPLFLSDLDTQIEAGYNKSVDEAPRAAPSFEGSRSESETFNVDLVQKTLIGTEARLSWKNQRLLNDAQFRVLDPSADSLLSLGIEQNLLRYFWGRPDVARRKRYRAEARAASEFLRQQSTDLAARVIRAALEWKFSTERIVIAKEAVTTAQRLVDNYKQKKGFGLIEESDELQAATSLEAEQTELLLAKSSLVTAQNALREFVGPEAVLVLSTSTLVFQEPAAPDTTFNGALAKALTQRGDHNALQAIVEAAEWTTRSEVLETMPKLSLNASYGIAGLNGHYSGAWDDLAGADHTVKSIGINLVSPIAYRKEKLQRQSKRLEFETAQENLKRLNEQVEREVKDAWETLHLSRERRAARERLVALQRKKYAAERENFQRGRSSTDFLVRFSQDIHQSEIAFLLARLQQQQAEVEMARSTGILLESFGRPNTP